MSPGLHTLQRTPSVKRWPTLLEHVAEFDAGERPAAQEAGAFLRSIDVTSPLESLTRLHFMDGRLVGFYSLASCTVHLSSGRRHALGVRRSSQPGVLLTWIAKSIVHPCDGAALLEDAVYEARKSADHIAATVLAVDPFDDETAFVWQDRFGFRAVSGAKPENERPQRLFIPLQSNTP